MASEGEGAGAAYTFGDSELAARRLAVVAETFEAPSRALLATLASPRPQVALDLGCGPGFTTRLIAECTGAVRVVGVDKSPAFIEVAANDAPSACEFVVGDVTGPLAEPGADLVYCRLLLAHLPDPAEIVGRWADQLRAGAVLALDEVEHIDAPDAVLATYESWVVDLVASRGALMYAGPVLDQMHERRWRRRASDLVIWPVPVARAAAMYRMNLEVWRHDPHVVATRRPAEVDDLARGLDALTVDGTGTVEWGIRHVVLEVT